MKFLLCLLTACAVAQAANYDLLIRNARVLDGAGNPWFRADIGCAEVRSQPSAGWARAPQQSE
jgi:hypothetical protein